MNLSTRNLIAWAVVTAALPVAASAGTLSVGFSHPVGNGSCITPSNVSSSIGPVTDSVSCSQSFPTIGNIQADASGTANYGLLQSYVHVVGDASPGVVLENTATTTSSMSGDLIFQGPGSQATTSLNLDMSGLMSIAPVRNGSASMRLTITLGSTTRTAIVGLDETNGGQVLGNNLSLSAPWLTLASAGGAAFTFQTEDFTVALNTPVTLTISLTANAFLNSGGEITSDFGHTLTFAKLGNVFTLGSGITVNGDGIVDNIWTGADTSVPEPATWSLLVAGLLFATTRACRHRL
ncbi:MAG: PEP-CTERM sorting domain-containing protein [Bryobacteraceae bacterium]